MKTIEAADLFCGAGGLTNGLKDAASELGLTVSLVAVNHWDIAIATHSANHPEVKHLCTGVENVDPRTVVPGGHLDILVAGPQCTFFSRARGGRPVNDQQRISPWLVLDWLEKLDISSVLIENVPELEKWGPVDPKTGKPVKKQQGKTFVAYLRAIRSLGYNVSYRVITCADYGDATTRERLFIMARKGKRVIWPEPTHRDVKTISANGQVVMFNHVQPWRPAKEIIDWNTPGTSIYGRKKPLSPNTLRRIEAGLRKFSGLPFIIGQQSGAAPRSVEDPVPAVATAGAISFIQPYLVKFYGSSDVSSVDAPLPTVTAQSNHLGICQPFLIPYRSERDGQSPRVHSIEDPVPTVTTFNGFGLVQPFIMTMEHSSQKAGSPFLVETLHGQDDRRVYSVDEPMKTITSVDAWAIAQPYLIQYNGTAYARSIEDPLPTATTKDRFGLAQPIFFKIEEQLYMLDILFRMLLPAELAAAMSFPKSYKFTGKREDVVKQIGNAVPRRTAAALCKALLS